MQAYGVWWFPPIVLNCAAVLLSLAWGLFIFTLSWLRWQSSANGTMVTCLAVMSTIPHFRLSGLHSLADAASTVFSLRGHHMCQLLHTLFLGLVLCLFVSNS